jgi:hypothetical protein
VKVEIMENIVHRKGFENDSARIMAGQNAKITNCGQHKILVV